MAGFEPVPGSAFFHPGPLHLDEAFSGAPAPPKCGFQGNHSDFGRGEREVQLARPAENIPPSWFEMVAPRCQKNPLKKGKNSLKEKRIGCWNAALGGQCCRLPKQEPAAGEAGLEGGSRRSWLASAPARGPRQLFFPIPPSCFSRGSRCHAPCRGRAPHMEMENRKEGVKTG